MTLRAKYKPELYCPICGRYAGEGINYFKHNCPKRILTAINSADTRASGEMGAFLRLAEPTIEEQYIFGFGLLSDDFEEQYAVML